MIFFTLGFCCFQGIDLFLLIFQIYEHEVFFQDPLSIFLKAAVSVVLFHLWYWISDFCLLPFFFKYLSVFLEVYQFNWFFKESEFCFINFLSCFQFYWLMLLSLLFPASYVLEFVFHFFPRCWKKNLSHWYEALSHF